MVKVNVKKSKRLKFGVSVTGVQARDLRGALRMTIEGIEYGFPAKVEDNSLVVLVPPLDDIISFELNEGQKIPATLEVIANEIYLVPWADTIRIEKPIEVAARITEDEVSEEKEKPVVKMSLTEDDDIEDEKKKVITEKKPVKEEKALKTKPKKTSRLSKVLGG